MNTMVQSHTGNHLASLHACIDSLTECHDIDHMLDRLPQLLRRHFSIGETRLLLLDSRSIPPSQLTANDEMADGVTSAPLIENSVSGFSSQHHKDELEIAMTGKTTRQQLDAYMKERAPIADVEDESNRLAIPIQLHGRLLGLLQVANPADCHFTVEDEKSLAIVAHYLALQLPTSSSLASNHRITVRRYTVDNSIFIDDHYLIKGVAGAILWKLVSEHQDHQRSEFCNRELRRDPTLGLPEVLENLESRLILLQRRLKERCPFLALEKTGRGRFHLRVDRLLQLIEV